ncbi:uncharacterized protein [Leptinotarsa decemlineata]|uniref:uncharacterized protein n=1 Tax=Leptinotarsa decemlineata TaxID=7539 RepID=UPI003D304E1C
MIKRNQVVVPLLPQPVIDLGVPINGGNLRRPLRQRQNKPLEMILLQFLNQKEKRKKLEILEKEDWLRTFLDQQSQIKWVGWKSLQNQQVEEQSLPFITYAIWMW